MLGRFVANAKPRKFLGPFHEVYKVELTAMSSVDENTPGGLCWIAKDKDECKRALGHPMEPGTKITVDLLVGEALWGVSGTTALIGYSVRMLGG